MGFLSTLGKIAGAVGGTAISALAGGSPVGAIGSAAAGALGSLANDSQNFENSMKLQQQGQEWQEKIIQQQNEWNSVGAQSKRYREAGINPYMALGNGQSGIVSSGGSSGINSAAPVSDAIAMSNEFQQLNLQKKIAESQITANNASAAKSQAEADTENQTRILKSLSYLKQNNLLDNQSVRELAQSKVLDQQEQLMARTQNLNFEIAGQAATRAAYETEKAAVDLRLSWFNLDHLDERFKIEMATAEANIALLLAKGRTEAAMREAQRAQAYYNTVIGSNQDYSPEQRKQFLESTLSSIKANAISAGIDADWREFNNGVDAAAKVIGSGVGVVGALSNIKNLRGKGK